MLIIRCMNFKFNKYRLPVHLQSSLELNPNVICDNSLNANMIKFFIKNIDIYQAEVIENYIKLLLKAPSIDYEIFVTNTDVFSNPD